MRMIWKTMCVFIVIIMVISFAMVLIIPVLIVAGIYYGIRWYKNKNKVKEGEIINE